MSVNTADANRAVLLHSGEFILIHCNNTTIELYDSESPEFRGTKSGHTYLTSHRIVFRNRSEADLLSSLSIPFVTMRDVSLWGNSITGEIQPQSNGNLSGEVKVKLTFKDSGATEFFQVLRTASCVAILGSPVSEFPLQIPAYKPSRAWYEAATSTYQSPEGLFDWIQKQEAFTIPRPNSVYITNDPPPYPGIRKHLTKPPGRPTSVHILEEPTQQVHDVGSFSPIDGLFPRNKMSAAGEEVESHHTLTQIPCRQQFVMQ